MPAAKKSAASAPSPLSVVPPLPPPPGLPSFPGDGPDDTVVTHGFNGAHASTKVEQIKAATEALNDATEKIQDALENEGGLPPKRPGKRPTIHVDQAEVRKVEKKLGKEAFSAISDMDHAELRAHLVTLAEHELETEQARDNDEDIKTFKADLANARGPYQDTLKFLKLRRRAALLLLHDGTRGKKVPGKKGGKGKAVAEAPPDEEDTEETDETPEE